MKKIALLFAGQGSQNIGMGKALYDEFHAARMVFEEANDVLGYDLKKVCFEGSLGELNKSDNMQLAILTCGFAAFKVYIEQTGIMPDCAAGHSIGEYAAMTASGAIAFKDALAIVRKRGQLAQNAANETNGAMTIISDFDVGLLEKECLKESTSDMYVAVSCYNASNQSAISGHQDAVLSVEDSVVKMGGNIMPLIMSAPFHCELMSNAAEQLEMELKSHKYSEFDFPVLSNVNCMPYDHCKSIVDLLTDQIRKPVRWNGIIEFLRRRRVDVVVDMGPQALLSNLIKAEGIPFATFSFDVPRERQELISWIESNAAELSSEITKCLVEAVSTKNCSPEDGVLKTDFAEAYKRMLEIQAVLKAEGKRLSKLQKIEAARLLKIVFDSKSVPEEVQKKKFRSIFNNNGIFEEVTSIR